MSLTATEELRIRAIESKLNEIQTALNNLAGKSQLKSTLGVIQRQINELNDLIGQVESNSSAAALTVHKTNSAAHSEINNRFFQRTEFVTTSSGVDDAGKPLKLNADGNIDASLVSLSLENHNTLSGLDQDDHPHYLNTSRHSAITGNPHSVTASEINAASSSELDTVSGTLQTQIDTKSDDGHIHDNRYYTETEVDVLFTDVNNNITTTSGLLQTAIDSKADTGHNHDSSYYTETEVDALLALLETADNTISGTLQTQIDNKANSSHTHDDRYYTESEIDGFGFTTTTYLDTVSGTLQTQINTKSDSSHLHNEIYYTEAEVDDFVSDLENSITTTSGLLRIAIDGKSDIGHLHDDRYYTESEIDSFDYANNTRVDIVSGELQTQINTKSDSAHIHDDRYYTEAEVDVRFSASGINISGVPVDNQLTIWTDNNTISGTNLKWDGELLQLGGETSSYPALKRSGTFIHARLADDSNYAYIVARQLQATDGIRVNGTGFFYWTDKSRLYSPTDGDLRVVNSTQDDFNLLQFGGTTSSYPALKRNGSGLRIRLADDSADTNLYINALSATGFLRAGGASLIYWNARSALFSPADGDVRLSNNAQDDFNLLQFGGTTSSYPAIKRDNTDLSLRLADDSDMASLHVEDITVSGTIHTDEIYALNNAISLFTDTGSMLVRIGGPSAFANTIDMSGGSGTGGITWRSDVSSMHYWNTFKSHVFTYHTNRNVNHDHGFQANPTIFVHSATSPNTDNTQWMGMTHDALNGVVTTGTGSLVLNPANDTVLIADGAATSMIQFGGTTSTYPAIKKLANTLQIKLADDSGFAGLYTGAILANSYIQTAGTNHFRWESKSRMFSDADGDIRLTDTTNADFNLLQFGGTTSSYPALKRSSTEIQSRLADDSAYANLRGNYISAEAGLSLGTGYYLTWSGRSRISSVADGDFRLTNQANNDFNMLQFGGITSSCPALKKSGVNLQARLADDSDYTDFTANTVSGVRGILPPALTNSEMDAIASPEQGLMIYNTTSGVMSVYDGSVWRSLAWV